MQEGPEAARRVLKSVALKWAEIGQLEERAARLRMEVATEVYEASELLAASQDDHTGWFRLLAEMTRP